MDTDVSTLEGAYSALRGRILDQREAPGATVTEAAVSSLLGVSRPTARGAIERLVTEGLLRREPHKAARVPALSADDIRDVFDSRAIVESAAVANLAAHGSLPAPALEAHRRLLAADHDDFADADIAFHRALVAGQSSPRLARMHHVLMGEIELCIGQVQAHRLLSPRDLEKQHQGILDAVIAGDAARAAQLTTEHVAGARDALLSHYSAAHAA
jgi:DNA-binding GntR family transcriptional regulator